MTDEIHKWIDTLHENNRWIIYGSIGGAFLGVIPSLNGWLAWSVWAILAAVLVVDRLHWIDIRSREW
jgi:hypothetical protein